MNRRIFQLAPLAGLLVVLAACSSGTAPSTGQPDSTSTDTPSTGMPMASGDSAAAFAWGEPAEAAEADRVIEITMLDGLRFEPDAVEVSVGETVTFKLSNPGQLPHDFTLGDEQTQDEHEAKMAGGGMSGTGQNESNALTLQAGEEGELTWFFTAPATILFGCHVPGHYDSGMVGTLTIAGS
ncbi:MAG: plastocyanin/azurin family copper-binding protein [Candidatus Limnocylindria bacterium]